MAIQPINLVWTSKPPEKLEDIAAFIARELLPILRQLRSGYNELAQNLLDGSATGNEADLSGFLDIFGVRLRFGSGVPTEADANGSLYVRIDAPSASTFLYYRFGGAWVLFGGGGLGMAEVKRIASLHP